MANALAKWVVHRREAATSPQQRFAPSWLRATLGPFPMRAACSGKIGHLAARGDVPAIRDKAFWWTGFWKDRLSRPRTTG
jgi:hypothetical protein